jgi:monomeric isocitrate dehydrogenase
MQHDDNSLHISTDVVIDMSMRTQIERSFAQCSTAHNSLHVPSDVIIDASMPNVAPKYHNHYNQRTLKHCTLKHHKSIQHTHYSLHVPSDVIIDASMPNVVRDKGCMWGAVRTATVAV